MYGWLWRTLPGGTATRASTMIVLIAALVAALWFVASPGPLSTSRSTPAASAARSRLFRAAAAAGR